MPLFDEYHTYYKSAFYNNRTDDRFRSIIYFHICFFLSNAFIQIHISFSVQGGKGADGKLKSDVINTFLKSIGILIDMDTVFK